MFSFLYFAIINYIFLLIPLELFSLIKYQGTASVYHGQKYRLFQFIAVLHYNRFTPVYKAQHQKIAVS